MTTVLAGLDLAALLCSRVCHDLISATGAIVNGLEVLEDSKDEETRDFALALIKKSAGQAAARLQFCRLASELPVPPAPRSTLVMPKASRAGSSRMTRPSSPGTCRAPLRLRTG